jgi:hypothetical protein
LSVVLFVSLSFLAGCSSTKGSDSKVVFDVNELDRQGLIGPADKKRAISYEFCIPDSASCRWQIRHIDPSVEFYPGSRGRSQCGEGMLLCIGSTNQEDYQKVLGELASLEYVDRIEETFFE